MCVEERWWWAEPQNHPHPIRVDRQRKWTNDRMARKSWEADPLFPSLRLPEMLTVCVCSRYVTRSREVSPGTFLPAVLRHWVAQLQMLGNSCRHGVLHKSYKSSDETLEALSNTTPVWCACLLLSHFSFSCACVGLFCLRPCAAPHIFLCLQTFFLSCFLCFLSLTIFAKCFTVLVIRPTV